MKPTILQSPYIDDAEAAAQHPAVISLTETIPVAGEGVNNSLFCVARKLHLLGVIPDVIEHLLEQETQDCGRYVSPKEIERAVRNSAPDALRKRPRFRKWPRRNFEQIEAIGLGGIKLADLRRLSPVPLESSRPDAEAIIDALLPGNPLICANTELDRNLLTRPRDEWRGFLGKQQFIVPSAMSKRKGMTQEGKLSFRSLDNVGPRQHLAIECDFAEEDRNGNDTAAAPMLRRLAAAGITVADLCASIHWELQQRMPAALILHSGGKSLHAWYPCVGVDEPRLHRFMRYAVSLGADPATWNPVQFVRMPEGIRRPKAIRQEIHYFNPTAVNKGAQQ
jgi:hypothetical protein